MKEIFDNYVKEIKRPGADKLLAALEDMGYFTAPASSNHHLAKPGGLLEHSINVLGVLFKLTDILATGASRESIIIVALFHDLGKANYYNKPNYIENILKSGLQSTAKPYETNKESFGIPHEVSSLHILSSYIDLTEDETHAILYHNGLYTSLGYSLKGKERPLQTALHTADLWVSRFIEGKGF